MPIQYSPPAKNTGSKTSQAILTPTERAPLYCTSLVHQLSGNLDRGPCMEGAEPSKREGPRSRLREAKDEEGEESEETEVAAVLADTPEASDALNLAHSNHPLVSQSEQDFLNIMQHIT
ncbi:hypothetical protein O181_017275 [Austropuccinia psidii MF-1]|uniref:Uncharacterized protein n=1 Tax=Austropuccinia psidii MF-1 TaxID=1389203 RepID=A0A9Q3C6G6_9BASI|nr:hypothetical protein [Austropuccinia psidii MF-1]